MQTNRNYFDRPLLNDSLLFLEALIKTLCSALTHAFRLLIVNVWKSFYPATAFIVCKCESSRNILSVGHAEEKMKHSSISL